MHLKRKKSIFGETVSALGSLADIPAETDGFRGIDDETNNQFCL
jgi:hypothetical protein